MFSWQAGQYDYQRVIPLGLTPPVKTGWVLKLLKINGAEILVQFRATSS